MKANVIILLSVLLIFFTSCGILNFRKYGDKNDYYWNVLDQNGLALHETYLIILSVEINDSVYNVLTDFNNIKWYCKGSYNKVKRKLYNSMENHIPIEFPDSVLELSIMQKIIPSQNVDSIYNKGFDYFVRYYIDFNLNMLDKDKVRNYTLDELYYIFSIFFEHKYYLFSNAYNEVEIFKDYHIEFKK